MIKIMQCGTLTPLFIKKNLVREERIGFGGIPMNSCCRKYLLVKDSIPIEMEFDMETNWFMLIIGNRENAFFLEGFVERGASIYQIS